MKWEVVKEMPRRAARSKYLDLLDGKIRRIRPSNAGEAQRLAVGVRQAGQRLGFRMTVRQADGFLYVQASGKAKRKAEK